MAHRPSSTNDIPIQVLASSTRHGGHMPSTPTSTTIKRPLRSDGSLEPPKLETNDSEENENGHFLIRFKLYLVIAGFMLVGFLFALNGSFVATVSLSFCSNFFIYPLICFICLDLSLVDGSDACTYRGGLLKECLFVQIGLIPIALAL